ncbi:MAG: glycolate oxidase subunit GlcE [Acidisphaera sp.]|nr:glycolate oxidase subunit GlcE [Acidisphaera sp.]
MTGELAPEEESGITEAVRDAHRAAEPLLVLGNGSKASMLRPVQAARSLSTRAHRGITLYSPKELVLSARAGTPLAEIEAAVAAEGQHVIAEPPDFSALLGSHAPQTLGGVVAANLSGPRRVTWGAMRDHVLGMRAVNGTGEVIRSGGRVLKNVTGLDLCKLLTGSHGTLAVIAEITLKVLPAPPAVGTLVLRGLDARAGVAALSAALGSPYGVSAAAWLPAPAAALAGLPGGSAALIRVEEFAPSVAYRTGRLHGELAAFAPGDVLDDATSRAAWRAVRDATVLSAEAEDAVWRVSVRPSAGPDILAVAAGAGGRGFLDWGGGLVWIAAPAQAQQAIARAAIAAGGTWMLLRAPEPMRASSEVVPPEPPALARLTRRVKAAFDPRGILNPGRIYAGV